MALTATATQGLEFHREVVRDEILYLPGDPGDTYTRGDGVVATAGEGIVDPVAAGEQVIGTVAQTITIAALSVAFPLPGAMHPAFDTSSTLVAVKSAVPAGTPVYLVTFASHVDEVVLGYTAGTPSFLGTTGAGADDRPNGALVYVYEGPGIGEINVVADYDHTGHGDGELAYITHRKFATALTTASKLIQLSGEAATNKGVGFFGRTDMADANNVAVNDGADDGKYVVYLDWRDAATHLKNLRLPVIPASALHLA